TQNNITSGVVYTSNLQTVAAGCDSIIETTITITAAFNTSETASVCSGESYTFPDGTTLNNITSQVVYSSTLQAISISCDSIVETTVNIAPDYNLTQTASVCAGESFTFPDGSSQTITSQVVYTSNLFTVGTQCDSIIETTVNVNLTYDLTGSATVCSGDSYTFPDGSSQVITSQVVYTSNLQTVSTSCDSIIETTVDVMTVDAGTSVAGNIISADLAGATYQWIDCDNGNAPISGATDQDYMPTASGNYAVEVTDGNCAETSGCVNMTITGIREASETNLRIYPIPTSSILTIESDQLIKQATIYTINGSLVRTYSQNVRTIDVSELANGMYLLVTQTETSVSQSRFIKE
ncbi:MAG: T9SS type A sorting domain-containing protein, partial [Flavobacteriales bacterium]|nr:T9SS type A sorting domain-containing protein [Flavobacteriales bacterium]